VPAVDDAASAQPPSPQSASLPVNEAIKKQIEYYFSKENLGSDAFLMSQMDASMSVSIAVIMKVPSTTRQKKSTNSQFLLFFFLNLNLNLYLHFPSIVPES
jgi:hypothetical protein